MNNLDALIAKFEKFPGVGARQARRFAFYILTMPEADTEHLASLITSIQSTVTECHSCHRFFSQNGGSRTKCDICSDPNRDNTKLLIVSQDSDIIAIERSGVYEGMYFVLGGTVPLLDKKFKPKLRSGALKAIVSELKNSAQLKEIILGFSINPDGENTARYVETLLEDLLDETNIKTVHLGRGLSTGSELEYADPETIRSALKNRY